MHLLKRQPERCLTAAGGERALGEERTEVRRRAFDGAELGIQAIDERSGRGGERQRREVGERARAKS